MVLERYVLFNVVNLVPTWYLSTVFRMVLVAVLISSDFSGLKLFKIYQYRYILYINALPWVVEYRYSFRTSRMRLASVNNPFSSIPFYNCLLFYR